MTQPTIYSADQPGGRPATDAEIKAVLDQYTAADGAVDFHALWLASQAEEKRDQVTAAVARVNQLAQNLVDASYAQRPDAADAFRTALNQLRELNGGHLPQLTAMED
jgi:hypothetical protein